MLTPLTIIKFFHIILFFSMYTNVFPPNPGISSAHLRCTGAGTVLGTGTDAGMRYGISQKTKVRVR